MKPGSASNRESCELPCIRPMTEGIKVVKLKPGAINIPVKVSHKIDKFIHLAKIYTPNKNLMSMKMNRKRSLQNIKNGLARTKYSSFSKAVPAVAKKGKKHRNASERRSEASGLKEHKLNATETLKTHHSIYAQTFHDFKRNKIEDLLKRPSNFVARRGEAIELKQLSPAAESRAKPRFNIRRVVNMSKKAVVLCLLL